MRSVVPGAQALEPTHLMTNGRYSVSLWGENLTDETVITAAGQQTVFGGINGLLSDQVPEARRAKALDRLNAYLGKAPGSDAISNWVYRALPVSYDWVPTGTPRSETAVNAPVVSVQQTNASR